MKLAVALKFNGNCREAIELYTKTFNIAMPEIMTYGQFQSESEMEFPEEAKNLVMYASLHVSGVDLMIGDSLEGLEGNFSKNIVLVVAWETADEVRQCYNALKEDGIVNDELQDTDCGELCGVVTDKFGVQWQIMLG